MDKEKFTYNPPFVSEDDTSGPLESPLEAMVAINDVCRGKIPNTKENALAEIRERLAASKHKNAKHWVPVTVGQKKEE